MFEIVLQQRDNFGNPTGHQKYYKAENGNAVHDFYVKYTPQKRKKKKKKSETSDKEIKKNNKV